MLGRLRRWMPLFAIAFLLLGGVFLVSGKSAVSGLVSPLTSKHLVSCDVDVSNKILQSPKIESMFCQKRSACLLSFSPSLASLLPSDRVTVQSIAEDGAKSQAVKLDITEQTLSSTAVRVELGACTTSVSGAVKLYDKDSRIIDSVVWNVGVN